MKTTPEYGLRYPEGPDLLEVYPALAEQNAYLIESLLGEKLDPSDITSRVGWVNDAGKPLGLDENGRLTVGINAITGDLDVANKLYVDTAPSRITDLEILSLDTITTPGVYSQPQSARALPSRNYPLQTRASLQVIPMNAATPNQLLQVFTAAELGRVFIRYMHGADNWLPWIELGAGGGARSGGGGGAEHILRERDLRRRIGPIRTGGAAPVAIVCDHGTEKFKSIWVPALRARGLRVTLALNAGRDDPSYIHRTGEGTVTWAEISDWADEGLIEVANHSFTHSKDSYPDFNMEIRESREFIESQINQPVDSWVQPGTGVPGWDPAFEDGRNLDSYISTEAGEIVFASHAVVSGSIYQGAPRDRDLPLDGEIPVGFQGAWMDRFNSSDEDRLKEEIELAVTRQRRFLLRHHPNNLNDGTNIDTASLHRFLDHLEQKQADGDIMVMSLREWAIADV